MFISDMGTLHTAGDVKLQIFMTTLCVNSLTGPNYVIKLQRIVNFSTLMFTSSCVFSFSSTQLCCF